MDSSDAFPLCVDLQLGKREFGFGKARNSLRTHSCLPDFLFLSGFGLASGNILFAPDSWKGFCFRNQPLRRRPIEMNFKKFFMKMIGIASPTSCRTPHSGRFP